MGPAERAMERALQAMLEDMERSGPEGVGAPIRAVTFLASEFAELVPASPDPLARRRKRASAARLARRALSLATEVHGVIADRPDAARAWSFNAHEVSRRLEDHIGDAPDNAAECVRSLARVAALALALPVFPDEDEGQAEMIAFADENVLADLHETCLELSTAAIRVATAGVR